MRLVWPSTVEAEELPVAYLLDSILLETVFIGGQLLAGPVIEAWGW